MLSMVSTYIRIILRVLPQIALTDTTSRVLANAHSHPVHCLILLTLTTIRFKVALLIVVLSDVSKQRITEILVIAEHIIVLIETLVILLALLTEDTIQATPETKTVFLATILEIVKNANRSGSYINITSRCSWKCPVGCRSCSESRICSVCEYGWSLTSSNNTCSCAFNNCRQCGTSSCHSCIEGYYLDANGNRKASIPNCRQLNSYNACDICEPGYTLQNNSCVSCPSGCHYCSNNNNCTACENSFVLRGDTNERYCNIKTYTPYTGNGLA